MKAYESGSGTKRVSSMYYVCSPFSVPQWQFNQVNEYFVQVLFSDLESFSSRLVQIVSIRVDPVDSSKIQYLVESLVVPIRDTFVLSLIYHQSGTRLNGADRRTRPERTFCVPLKMEGYTWSQMYRRNRFS